MVSFLIRPVPSVAVRFERNYHLRQVPKLKYVNVTVAYAWKQNRDDDGEGKPVCVLLSGLYYSDIFDLKALCRSTSEHRKRKWR